MKILTVAWSVFERKNNALSIGTNGFAVMVSNICEYIGRKEKSFLFVGAEHVPEMKFGHMNVMGNGNFFPDGWTSVNIGKWRQSMVNEFKKAILSNGIEFVFIHGAGLFNLACIEICRKELVPYAVVLHGDLYRDRQNVKQEYVEAEKKTFSIPGINIITVSSGCRNQFMKDYTNIYPSQITAIVNGIPSMQNENKTKASTYNFGCRKVILCPASLSPRKNQIQLIRAVALLPKEMQDKILVVLCGKDSKFHPMLSYIQNEIAELGISDCISYIGAIPVSEMPQIYSVTDVLVLPSLMEGLSLVTLEAIQHGKPVIMYADNETASDVNSPDATILVKERSDQALADAIVEWYERDWDIKKIKEYSKNFTIERVADEYILYAKEHSREN